MTIGIFQVNSVQVQRQVNLFLSNRKTLHTRGESFSFNFVLPLFSFHWLRFWLEDFMLDFWTILKKSFETWCDLWPTIFNKSVVSGLLFILLSSAWEKSQELSGKYPNICRKNLHICKMIDFEFSWHWIIFLCWTKVLFNIFIVWLVLHCNPSVKTSAIWLLISF